MVHDITEAEAMVRERRPRFYAALLALGEGDTERARALDVQRITVRRYRLGLATPRYILDGSARQSFDPAVLRNRADLVSAYTEDLLDELESSRAA